MKRVAIADDHQLVRAGLRSLIELMPRYCVVGEANDGQEILELVRRVELDILIVDISMRPMSGLDALPAVKRSCPSLPVLILSMHDDGGTVTKALAAGAAGYLVKDSAESELEIALDAVLNGKRYLSPRVAETLLRGSPGPDSSEEAPHHQLTGRQLQILRMLALGYMAKEIAFDLNLSNKTVEAHRSKVMERLGLRNVAQLVHYAIRHGLVGVDEVRAAEREGSPV
ncbi:response regulator transcription factor [Proteobacteria bacterium 005FR1]|nr:response regulator transcription factor [Proteobacteria bacterium 005FR1]